MASRFVSGGTNDEPTERDEAWLKAQQAIEAKRQEKVKIGEQADGKSLYETLQANQGDCRTLTSLSQTYTADESG